MPGERPGALRHSPDRAPRGQTRARSHPHPGKPPEGAQPADETSIRAPGEPPGPQPPQRRATYRRRYDLYSRFAERHLRTDAERAVYLTLVAQVAPTWTAETLARSKGLDAGEVRAVLDRYLAAGIVELGDGPVRRYRWRSDMTYLGRGAQPDAWLVDPVCGMPVDPSSPYRTQDASHAVTLFCAATCLALFEARGPRPDPAAG